MFFQNPVYLYGLFSLAIPVIIHLFNFQRPKVVYFTNLKFIKLADENTKKGIALKHLLILLMRLLFLFFLVVAFAKPTIGTEGSQAASGSVAVYLDNSMSMQNQVSNGRAIESGLGFLTSLADASPEGTRFRFTDNSFRYQDQAFLSKEKFKDRLTEESYTYSGRDFKSVWNRQLLAGSESDFKKPKTVYWLSDFQKSTAGDLTAFKPDSSIQLKIIPIQNKEVANVFVDSVWLESPFIKHGEINYLKAKISNTGKKDISGLSISCLVNEKPSGTSSVDIPPTSSVELEFGFTTNKDEELKIKLAFEEQPVTFDNEFFAVIHPMPKINISVVAFNPQSYVKKVFEGEDAFLLETFSLKNINYSFLQKSNLVVVEDFDKMDENVLKFLQGYVSKGGHILLVPSENPSAQKLGSISNSFGLSSLSIPETDGKTSLAIPDKRQPFFAGIFVEIKSDMAMPEVKNTVRWSGWNEDILISKSNYPYFSLKKSGKGSVYLLGSPLDAKYTNLASHSIFVPLMYKLAIRSQKTQEKLAFRMGESNVQLQVQEGNPNSLYTLSNEKSSIIPEQKITGNVLTLTFPKENRTPGFYTLSATGIKSSTIALNADKNESDMATYSLEELKSIFAPYPSVEIVPMGVSESISATTRASLASGEFWKICIILSLIFLLGEILLIRFFK